MEKLPFLVSIPHGGVEKPNEILNHVGITQRDLFDDSDAYTYEIYDVADLVHSQQVMAISRAFVDVNRSVEQLPPAYPDGLVKSATCYRKPIYVPGKEPTKEMIKLLIERYYRPFHQKIEQQIHQPAILMGLDCHSMAEIGPDISPDQGQRRPLVNLGDLAGSACDPQITHLLQKIFMDVLELEKEEVRINSPFKGGYITRKYGMNPKPWIQIELNRSLYLSSEYFDQDRLQMKGQRLQELNAQMRKVFALFYQQLKTSKLL